MTTPIKTWRDTPEKVAHEFAMVFLSAGTLTMQEQLALLEQLFIEAAAEINQLPKNHR